MFVLLAASTQLHFSDWWLSQSVSEGRVGYSLRYVSSIINHQIKQRKQAKQILIPARRREAPGAEFKLLSAAAYIQK